MNDVNSADRPAVIRVDLRGVMVRRIGTRQGLSRADERAWTRRLRSAADEVREAADSSVLPHYNWWCGDSPEVVAQSMPVVVRGESGAVDAVCLGLPHGGQEAVFRQSGPDDASVVVVDSPPNMGDASPEDLRFGPFGPTARALRLALLGSDELTDVASRVADAIEACGKATTDTGAELALGLANAAWNGACPTIICSTDLVDLGRWWARVLTATTCKTTGDSGPQVVRGLAPRVAELGDEAALQATVFGQPASPAVLIASRAASPQTRSQLKATADALARRGCPVVSVSLRSADTAEQVAAAWVLLHSALTLAIAIGAQPLTLEAGEDLRRLLDSTGDAPA